MAAISALLEMSFNFGSWMFIGICLLVVQCCLTLFYSCVFAGVIFKGECCRKLVAGDWFNWIAGRRRRRRHDLLGLPAHAAVGVTLWNTALIPLLWIMSGMASAMGCIELLAISGRIPHEKVLWSRRTSLWVEAAELFTSSPSCTSRRAPTSAAAPRRAEALLSGPRP